MAMTVRAEPINRDIALFLDDLSPPQRSARIASYARLAIEEAKQTNRSALGRVPPWRTFVDGHEGSALEAVRPDGIIFTEFQLVSDLLKWISDQLERHSPVKTGRYKKSHIVLADGIEIMSDIEIPDADEFVFINVVPYARKIERGLSSQAPDGVYQVVAALARRRFLGIANITFSYRTVLGGVIVTGRAGNRAENRNPAIIVRVGR